MTKLLITEKLITNKQDFIKFSNIPDTVEFVKYSEFSSNTTASLFEENNIKFIYDQFVNFRDLSNNNYKFSSLQNLEITSFESDCFLLNIILLRSHGRNLSLSLIEPSMTSISLDTSENLLKLFFLT